MKNKRGNLIIESINMIKMYCKTYTFLSVTIVISLSALFVFLVYNDSKIYNEYKEVMGASDKIGMLQFVDDNNIAQTIQAIDQIGNVNYYYYYTQQLAVGDYQNAEIYCNLNITPGSIFAFYHDITSIMMTENGQSQINLNKGEIAISENLYKCIEGQKEADGELYIDLDILLENGEYRTYRFHVVNILQEMNEKPYLLDDNLIVYSDAIVSESNFEDVKIHSVEKKLTIYADNPETVSQKLEKVNVNLDMVYTHKQEMNEAFINAGEMKKMLCIALLFLLGINLYSSFNNALNERKHEIAIRIISLGQKEVPLCCRCF